MQAWPCMVASRPSRKTFLEPPHSHQHLPVTVSVSAGLEKNAFTQPCCEDVAFALEEDKTLLKLDLKKNKLQDKGISRLLRALGSPRCMIQKLGLHSCSLSDGSCKQHSSALAKISSLRRLNLCGNIFTDRCAADMKILIQRYPSLTEITCFSSSCPSIRAWWDLSCVCRSALHTLPFVLVALMGPPSSRCYGPEGLSPK
ncbi:ribonuclease inhibitor-like [Rhea pennata]|uniref:ribonuclease inhibitor-like n=1 Tax=Rhea pennata TaxID=8795 RepID=UPI002E255AA1